MAIMGNISILTLQPTDDCGRYMTIHDRYPCIHKDCVIMPNGGSLEFFDAGLPILSPIHLYSRTESISLAASQFSSLSSAN